MRVFIQAKNGTPTDQDHFNAYIRFREMGFETVFFETFEELAESKMDDVVVGYIGTVAARLRDFNREIEDMDYPEVLRKYLKRRLWKSTAKYGKLQPGDVACFYETDSQQKIQRPNYSRTGGFDRMRKLL